MNLGGQLDTRNCAWHGVSVTPAAERPSLRIPGLSQVSRWRDGFRSDYKAPLASALGWNRSITFASLVSPMMMVCSRGASQPSLRLFKPDGSATRAIDIATISPALQPKRPLGVKDLRKAALALTADYHSSRLSIVYGQFSFLLTIFSKGGNSSRRFPGPDSRGPIVERSMLQHIQFRVRADRDNPAMAGQA
jgi:hypothetical protein